MFNFWRNWRKTAGERQQEMLHAYVDEALSSGERRQFEEQMAADADLQQELAQIQQMKAQLRQLPRRRVPRNFTLDPAVYSRPQRQPLFQLYPVMRTAMVLTAFFFIFALAADLFVTGSAQPEAASAPSDIALRTEDAAEMEVAVTRVTVETVVEGETVFMEAEEPVAEMVVEELAAEEEEMAEAAAELEVMPAAPEEEPPSGDTADEDMADDAAAGGEATTKTAVPPAVGIASELAGTAAPPSPTPLATLTANVAATETADGSPRVTDDEAAAAADRAASETTTEPASELETAESTQPPPPAPEFVPEPGRGLQNPWRAAQISLGVLLVLLATAVWYVRRNS